MTACRAENLRWERMLAMRIMWFTNDTLKRWEREAGDMDAYGPKWIRRGLKEERAYIQYQRPNAMEMMRGTLEAYAEDFYQLQEELENLKAAEEGTPKTQKETPRTQQEPEEEEEEEAPSSPGDSITSVASGSHSGDSATTLPGRDHDAPGVLDRGGGWLLDPRVSA